VTNACLDSSREYWISISRFFRLVIGFVFYAMFFDSHLMAISICVSCSGRDIWSEWCSSNACSWWEVQIVYLHFLTKFRVKTYLFQHAYLSQMPSELCWGETAYVDVLIHWLTDWIIDFLFDCIKMVDAHFKYVFLKTVSFGELFIQLQSVFFVL